MSQISYELKRKKLCEAQKYSRFKLQGILALIKMLFLCIINNQIRLSKVCLLTVVD